MAEYERRWPEYAALRGEARVEKTFPRLFGAVTAQSMFPGLLEVAREWQPDLVVSEAGDFAAPVVAAALGIPQVTHAFGLVVPQHRVASAAEFAGPLWGEVGLAPRPFGGVYDHMYIDVYPPSMQPDDLGYIERIVRRRPQSLTAGDFAMDESVRRVVDTDRPLVYVTFGTVFNRTPTFDAAVDALRSLDEIVAIVTVGPDGDVDAFGSLPDHVAIARYVSQNDVFGETAAVVSHAGSGTLLGALGVAIPQVCLPQAADQFRNADACTKVGAGIALRGEAATGDAIATAITAVLTDPTYHSAASAVAREITTMPAVDDVAVEVERLVEGGP